MQEIELTRRKNLRTATRSQNQSNRRKLRKTTSIYKGVFWHDHNQKWIAQIRIDNKQIYLGSFNTEYQAAYAYNQAAKEYFGDYAYLNIIEN